MGSSPLFSLQEDDPNSRFLDLFNRFGNQSQNQEFGQYLKPDDPDLLKYQQLSSSPTGSESLISDYINSRPERPNPSFGRKLAATLIGTLSGGGRTSREFLDNPYNQAIEDWKAEGSNIASRARLIDSERSRELSGLKYGLTNKVNQGRAKAQDERFQEQEARRVAGSVAAEEETRRKDEEHKAEVKFRQNMADEIFNAHKENTAYRKQQDLERNTRLKEEETRKSEERAAKASDLGLQNKKLSNYASTQGVDTSKLTALDTAKELALRKAKAHPAFGDLIKEEDGEFSVDPSIMATPRGQSLKIYLSNLTQKMLRGEY